MFAVLLAAASPVALYAQSIHAVSIGGAGRDPCSAWTQDRSATTDAGRQASQARIEWVSGFFSAVNLFTQPSGSLHGGIDDRDGMISWLDSYCRDHPGAPLFAASADLFFDLKNHPRK